MDGKRSDRRRSEGIKKEINIYGEIEAGLSQLLRLLFTLLNFHLGTLLHRTDLPLQEKKKM